MASRRDQVMSYRFMLGRSVSAFLVHDTDPIRPPLRGVAGPAFAGVIVAALAVLGTLVYGMVVRGGNTSWRTAEAMVVERETGTRYVYRDGLLYPVTNQTSAMLLGATSTVDVARASLDGTPRGPLLGIVGAPESPPAARSLAGDDWLFCVRAARDDAGTWRTVSVLTIGGPELPVPDQPLLDQALLVRAPDDPAPSLVWHGHRYEVRDADTVLTALAWRQVEPTPVDAGWLNAIPVGDAIGRVTHPSFGSSSAFHGVSAGRVFFVQTGGGRQYYAAVNDGLAPITALQADILRGDRAVNRDQRPAEEIQAAAVVLSAASLAPGDGPGAPPAAVPVLATTDPGLSTCAAYRNGSTQPTLLRRPATAPPATAVRTAGTNLVGTRLADFVVVPPGRGVLVAAGTPDRPGGTLLLVMEPGVAYPVPPAAVSALGYEGVSPVRLPFPVVARIPVGPALDPSLAAVPVVG